MSVWKAEWMPAKKFPWNIFVYSNFKVQEIQVVNGLRHKGLGILRAYTYVKRVYGCVFLFV